MESSPIMNQFFLLNNIPINTNMISNNLNLQNNVNDSKNKENLGIRRLTNFEFNKNVNIYEDENYEFKQFVINSEKDIYARVRQNMKYFSAFLNSNEGILYFGINDFGVIKGIDLTSDLKRSFELELEHIIDSYDEHIKKNNNITYIFHEVTNVDETKLDENKKKYVIEIYIKVGLPDHIYTTPFKEDETDDYGCYIKLNGTVKKIAGEHLFYYTKNKIMKYVKSLADKKNAQN